MTSYDYITFDPVGFYPNNYHSRVITFKNVQEYKFLKEIKAEAYTNLGNDGPSIDDPVIIKYYQKCCKYLKDLTLETLIEDFKQVPGFRIEYDTSKLKEIPNFEINPVVDDDMFGILRAYQRYWEDYYSPFINYPDLIERQLDSEYINFTDCVLNGKLYEGFTIISPVTKLKPFKNENLIPNYNLNELTAIANTMQANLTDFAKLMSAWLCSLSQIVILWQHEFYQLALEDFKEWTIACKYAQSQDFLEDAVPFEDFLDYLINNCQNMDRQRYFLDNRYNLKIFTARIGGFSILHWLEMVYFRDKTKGIYDRDKALYFVNEYLGFAGLCGYDTNDLEFKNYIRSLINQYVPLEEYVAKEQESTLEILKKDYSELLEKYNLLYEKLPEKHKSIALKLVDCIKDLDTDLYQKILIYIENYKKFFSVDQIEIIESFLDIASGLIKKQSEDAKQKESEAYQLICEIGQQFGLDVVSRLQEELEKGTENAFEIVVGLIRDNINNQITSVNDEMSRLQRNQQDINAKNTTINDQKQAIIAKNQQIQQNIQTINDQSQTIDKQNLVIEEKDKAIIEKDQTINVQNQAIIEKEKSINEKDQTISIQNQAINEKEKSIKDKEVEIENLQKNLDKLNQQVKQYNESKEFMVKAEEFQKVVKENNKLHEIIEGMKAENKKLSDQINKQLQEFEKNKLKSKDLQDKENKLNEKEANLNDKETKINEQVKETNNLLTQFNESIDKRLEELIIHISPNIGPDIRIFREVFFEKFRELYPDVSFNLDARLDSCNDVTLGTKTVTEWHKFYLDKINKKVIRDDFNPEGTIMQTTQRLSEEAKIRSFIRDQTERGIYLDFNSFKMAIMQCAFDEDQYRYFQDRFNHLKIGTAIFGSKTIDEWYKVLASALFSHEE